MPLQILEEGKNIDKETEKEDNILANFIILSIFIIIVLLLKVFIFLSRGTIMPPFLCLSFIILLWLYFLILSYYFYHTIKKC